MDVATGSRVRRRLPGGTLCHGPLMTAGDRVLWTSPRGVLESRALTLRGPARRLGRAPMALAGGETASGSCASATGGHPGRRCACHDGHGPVGAALPPPGPAGIPVRCHRPVAGDRARRADVGVGAGHGARASRSRGHPRGHPGESLGMVLAKLPACVAHRPRWVRHLGGDPRHHPHPEGLCCPRTVGCSRYPRSGAPWRGRASRSWMPAPGAASLVPGAALSADGALDWSDGGWLLFAAPNRRGAGLPAGRRADDHPAGPDARAGARALSGRLGKSSLPAAPAAGLGEVAVRAAGVELALDARERDHPAGVGHPAPGAGGADEHPLVGVAPARQQPAPVGRPRHAGEAPATVEQAPGRASPERHRHHPPVSRGHRGRPPSGVQRQRPARPCPAAAEWSPAGRPHGPSTLTSRGRRTTSREPSRVHSRSRTAPPAATDHRVRAAVHVAGHHPSVASGPAQDVPRHGPPAGGHRRDVPARSAVPGAVTRHHPHGATLEVGHAIAEPGRPGRPAHRPGPHDGPANGAVGLHRVQAPAARGGDVEATGRPAGVGVVAQPSQPAVRPVHPGSRRRAHQQVALRGQPGEAWVRAHAVGDPVAHVGPGRRERRAQQPEQRRARPPPPPVAGSETPPGVGRARPGPRAARRRVRSPASRSPGAGRSRRARLELVLGHGISPTESPSRSSARRSREFTVPRGIPSIRADLTGRAVEQVAEHHHGTLLGAQPGQRRQQLVRDAASPGRVPPRTRPSPRPPRGEALANARGRWPGSPRCGGSTARTAAASRSGEAPGWRRGTPPARCPPRRPSRAPRSTRRGRPPASACGTAPPAPRPTRPGHRARAAARSPAATRRRAARTARARCGWW